MIIVFTKKGEVIKFPEGRGWIFVADGKFVEVFADTPARSYASFNTDEVLRLEYKQRGE
jgi:hypothetical protein